MDRNWKIYYFNANCLVALRKESVDRNLFAGGVVGIIGVALRKESVDRNFVGGSNRAVDVSRSPQGERG